jgi:hypothetical protein
VIETLEFCLGEQTQEATVIHVRGVCAAEIPFAGYVVVSEGRATPEYDLKTYGSPLDLEYLASAIDRLLGEDPTSADEIRRICE